MSKFSKILAVLMAVCLLLGATTAFLASAEEKPVLAVGDKQGAPGTEKTKTSNFNRNQKVTDDYDLKDFAYWVFDADINLVKGTDTPNQLRFEPSVNNDAGSNKSLVDNPRVFFVEKDGSFYMSFTDKDQAPNENAKISNEEGVYSHFTFVLAVDSSTEGIYNIVASFYIDGVFIAETPVSTNQTSRLIVSRFATKAATNGWKGATYNQLNQAVNLYAAGGEKAEAVRAVVDSKEPLYSDTTGSLVYNAHYVLPNGNVVASIDGKNVYIPDAVETALSSINDGSEIETKVDIVDFDIPDGVEKFTLTYNPEETEFSICEDDAKEFFIIKNSENTYTVRKATENDKLMLKRVVEYGDKELVISSAEFVFLLAPENDVTFTYFELNGLKLYTGTVSNWTIDVDGDVPEAINLYDPEAIRGLTDSEAALIREEFDGILIASATAEDDAVEFIDFSDYAYIAGYEKNGVFTPKLDSNGGYENYKDIATLEAEKATWDADVVYYEIVDGKAQVPGSGTTTPVVKPGDGLKPVGGLKPVTPLRPGTTGALTPTDVTDLVKNTSKDNGTVDGCGILIIR